jgi:prolyl 4-hydroxylase
MKKMTELSGAWALWIEENLGLGCSTASMLEAMMRENFDPAFAVATLEHFARRGSTEAKPARSAPVSAGYAYDAPLLPQDLNVIHTTDRDVRVVFRVKQPVVAVFDDVLSHAECDELIRLSQIKLQRSTIVDPETGTAKVIEARSSDGTFFHRGETAFIARLDRRIAELMHLPVNHGEGLQILRYGVGGEYRPHFDYFPPDETGSSLHLSKGGQRVSTLIVYLSDVTQAGETIFPKIGLSVVPRKGSAVYFEYCNRDGQVDPMTLHGGEPVAKGEKWIATKWMRQRPYN